MTAAGTSALASVRLAGPGVGSFLARRFSRRVVPGRPTHGELRDDRGTIDDPVVVLRADGRAGDLTLHGGSAVLASVLALVDADGFARAPVDAETVGSTDAATIFEHELLVALPSARTELAVRTLLAQPAAWAAFIASSPGEEAIARVRVDRSLERLLNPPAVAIVGVPNAGKSTLANALFGRQRSIVADLPGTTRDWVGEEADLDGLIVRLIDTPGLRKTPDPIERAAIAASEPVIRGADLTLLVLDATRDDAEQAALVERIPTAIVVLNKVDVALDAWRAARPREAIETCAHGGHGVAAVIGRVRHAFGVDEAPRPLAWTRRQRALLSAGDVAGILAPPSP